MRAPHFVRLAEIDDRRFVSACRHGLVHLTWGRTTTRFSRDEFRRLVALLQRSADAPPPASFREGKLSVTCRLDDDCEFQMGPLVLLLSAKQFQEFVTMVSTATRRMDQLLDSGVWDEKEPEETPEQPGFLEQFRKPLFSRN